jgi:hypothetical protein
MHHGLDRGSKVHVAIPPLTHFFASMLTLNNGNNGPCAGTLVPLYGLLIGLTAYTWWMLGMTLRSKA